MAIPVSLDHRPQECAHQNRSRKPLVNHGCHLGSVVPQRGRAEYGKANLVERHAGQIKHLSSSRLILSVHPVLEILIWLRRNPLLGLVQQVHPLAEDDCARGTHFGAGRLLAPLQALVETKLALDNFRIPLVPFELWHIERAGHLTVTAADTERAIPRDRAPLALLQGPKWAAGHAGGIEAVHALPFDEGEASTGPPVELDNVLGLRVEIRRDVPETGGQSRFKRQAIGS